MAQRVPKRKLYHENWKRAFVQNSREGNLIAHDAGIDWLDNDWHVSLLAEMLANEHGWPETIWGTDRPETVPAATLKRKRAKRGGKVFHIRDFPEALRDLQEFGQSMEAEVKNWKPYAKQATLRQLMGRMAGHARKILGDRWCLRLNVKIVSTMGGGWNSYGVHVAEAAHWAGIPVLVTARGKDRFRRKWPATVTYVRGSLVPVR